MADKLKAAPKVARPVTPGRIPSPENLINKTPFELIKTLKRFGIDPDTAAIDRRAKRSFRMLDEMTAEGKMPSEAQWERMAQTHERELNASLREMTKTAIRLNKAARRNAQPDDLEMWMTSEGDNVCPDCEPLHAQVKPHKTWVKLGLPGTSKHFCGKFCNCELVPASEAA